MYKIIECAYDKNGNLTKDLNRNIIDIQYNFLNLPCKVVFAGGDSITYVYAADGTKLRSTATVGGVTTTTDYCGNVIYENGVRKLLLTEAGYVTLADGKYHYYLQDHQGNNRVVVDEDGTVEEVNHYYPFGGVFASSANVQPYKYNGKELEKSLPWYDYGARRYDAVLGRFTSQDRYAEKYYSLSPYQYAGNNPMNFIDVNGDSIIISPNPNGLLDWIRMNLGFDTKYQQMVKNDLTQLKKDDSSVRDMIEKLERSLNIHEITMPKKGKFNATGLDFKIADKGIPQGTKILYDPYNSKTSTGNVRTPRVGLAHELQHSFDADAGTYHTLETENGIKLMDVKAINTENRIRKVTGDHKRTKYVENKEVPEWLLE